ncbi:hypothetical protein AKJ37_03165 [candidate division MSBL1 archaeon SCGC-AAA259I09]|uniref:Uncharacterized protein n=2 Tax=candidate division MSBL1 TaxID=215777 RepID=A0A133UT30_9EURY|nr:hypothetical protein AKJ36_03100 [candidate division MSBL1 archaeon SCGC-AAA259I07]KXA97358.1 hypothetical protein AKJ37_03165 [candidate division MSBL1 archaeon SCGC-AAA259I09]
MFFLEFTLWKLSELPPLDFSFFSGWNVLGDVLELWLPWGRWCGLEGRQIVLAGKRRGFNWDR